MNEERTKAGATFWLTVALVAVLAAYPLSAGPAEFWVSPKLRKFKWMTTTIDTIYAPLWWAFDRSPGWVRKATGPYFDWWALRIELPPP